MSQLRDNRSSPSNPSGHNAPTGPSGSDRSGRQSSSYSSAGSRSHNSSSHYNNSNSNNHPRSSGQRTRDRSYSGSNQGYGHSPPSSLSSDIRPPHPRSSSSSSFPPLDGPPSLKRPRVDIPASGGGGRSFHSNSSYNSPLPSGPLNSGSSSHGYNSNNYSRSSYDDDRSHHYRSSSSSSSPSYHNNGPSSNSQYNNNSSSYYGHGHSHGHGHGYGHGSSSQYHHNSNSRYHSSGGSRSPAYSRSSGGLSSSPYSRDGGSSHSGPASSSDSKSSMAAAISAMAKQRIYSDFRISRVKIGSFEVTENLMSHSDSSSHGGSSGGPPPQGVKDSRLRLYFRGSGNDTPRYANSHNNSNLSGYGSGNSTSIDSNNNNSSGGNIEDQAVRDRALAEPDRLSISIFNGTKRIVIPVQDGLEKVQFRRKDGYFRIQSRGWALFEELDFGHLRNNSGGRYNDRDRDRGSGGSGALFSQAAGHFRKCDDLTDGQLSATNGLIEVWINLKHPLPIEPKWTRGNLLDYIDSRSKYISQGVLEVLDPEHIIDFDSVVNLWVRESSISSFLERESFAKNYLTTLPFLLELCSKILAPPYYYVSRALAATSNNPSGVAPPTMPSSSMSSHYSNSGFPGGTSANSSSHLNTSTTAAILESGQIPALISPSVNTLLATTVVLARDHAKMADDELIALLKPVMFQVPEPILWRSLDGLFAKRPEPVQQTATQSQQSLLNFDADKVLDAAAGRTKHKISQIEAAENAAAALGKLAVSSSTSQKSKNSHTDSSSSSSNKRESVSAKSSSVSRSRSRRSSNPSISGSEGRQTGRRESDEKENSSIENSNSKNKEISKRDEGNGNKILSLKNSKKPSSERDDNKSKDLKPNSRSIESHEGHDNGDEDSMVLDNADEYRYDSEYDEDGNNQ